MSRDHAVNAIKNSLERDELIIVVGTGCSISLTGGHVKELSWKGLISSGFDFAKAKGKLTEAQYNSWCSMLDSTDIDDTLSAAEYVGRKLGAPEGDLYGRWLNHSFENVRPDSEQMAEALRVITSLGVPICTLNYDSLLEQVTGLPSINIGDVRRSTNWMRREESGILHLHGQWQEPATCILGIRDYEKTLNNEARDLFQKTLGSFKRLLFIGCGDTFSDPNFSALISWLRANMGASTPLHYALVNDAQMQARQSDEAWHGFVDPLSYGDSHLDLPKILTEIFTRTSVSQGKSAKKPTRLSQLNSALIKRYLEFLVRDCGQMTIEGVRADMDTAQRRFDLEKLFVPLELVPCPPDISLDDPARHEKLKKWRRKNRKEVHEFGQVFERTKGLALLALPGGGKSLLLKRLAVAYASPDRRTKSDDGLPEMELVPLLLRCREWRAHIALPIPTLLKSLPDITGQPDLEGLSVAFTPWFESGKVLLLIDGLDEIHDNADRTVFVENLRSFLDQYPSTKVVVTSREAGFDLVAPYLASRCERWRVAPLNEGAIRQLCSHWHKLMVGESLEAVAEAEELSGLLTSNLALKRLAENPLLLTMLLVVKHGAGRLPPDKVSLYNRGVEVLLDTWNIRGHDALNVKEAIPQLAYVAFELMVAGKQTATEQELLNLLEKARQNVPQISRYAKDTPYDFLKRVELRSSLLLEAGHLVENSKTVPFYQFRHLTFQEYLSALAIVEGHYDGYDSKTPLTKPLAGRLASEQWKEVVPMAAVLARKQAEPLVRALVRLGDNLAQKLSAGKDFPQRDTWLGYPGELPSVIGRLAQSLIEEAQAEPQTLASALRLIAIFARGSRAEIDWKALCRGPYADELLHQTWLLYQPMDWHPDTLLRNSYAHFAGYRKPAEYWYGNEGMEEISSLLNDIDPKNICLGLMTTIGAIFTLKEDKESFLKNAFVYPQVVKLIFSEQYCISHVALWSWALYRYRLRLNELPPLELLDQFLNGMFGSPEMVEHRLYTFALEGCLGLPRNYWQPNLTPEQISYVKEQLRSEPDAPWERDISGAIVIAFHSGKVCDDQELVQHLIEIRRLAKNNGTDFVSWRIDQALVQIPPYGTDYLNSLEDETVGNDEDAEYEDWGEPLNFGLDEKEEVSSPVS